MRSQTLVATAAFTAAFSAAHAQDSWYSVPLAPVAGMSRDGLVLVGRAPATSLAATWTAAHGVSVLPTLPGETTSLATSASQDGSIIVGTMTVNGTVRAFRYTAATGKQELGPVPAGYHSPEAADVSADGKVVVGLLRGNPGADQGFVWMAATGMTLFTHAQFSTLQLRSISADGQVYMGNGLRTGETCPQTINTFIWSQALGIAGTTITCFPNNVAFVVGEDLSGDGLTIAGMYHPTRNNGIIWRAATGMQIIMGTIGNHHAYCVNHDGTVVGGTTPIGLAITVPGIWINGSVAEASMYFQSRDIHYPPTYDFFGSAMKFMSADAKAFVIEDMRQPSPQGFAYVGPCPANCDGSSLAPRLTANDFQCFLNRFDAGDPRANCDGSTGTPALTANDFQCFLNQYATGCP